VPRGKRGHAEQAVARHPDDRASYQSVKAAIPVEITADITEE
jgi:hypothetical protein